MWCGYGKGVELGDWRFLKMLWGIAVLVIIRREDRFIDHFRNKFSEDMNRNVINEEVSLFKLSHQTTELILINLSIMGYFFWHAT